MTIARRMALAWVLPAAAVAGGVATAHAAPRTPRPGDVRGRVVLLGEAPKPASLAVTVDAWACGGPEKASPSLQVDPKGGVAYAMVSVAGLQGTRKGPFEMDQKGCEFVPHVLLAAPGAPVRFLNSDRVMHNVHAGMLLNRASLKGQVVEHTFRDVGPIAIACDVHHWMSGWVVVSDRAHAAVTGSDGGFSLTGVPAGKHTLEVWHETLGTFTLPVEVKPGQTADVEISMPMPATTRSDQPASPPRRSSEVPPAE